MVNMVRAPMNKVNNKQGLIGNVSREMKMLRDKKEIPEVKKAVTEKKWRVILMGSLVDDTTEETMSELEDMAIETSKCEEQRQDQNQTS
jgi:aspartate aminotransferase-like enzyme